MAATTVTSGVLESLKGFHKAADLAKAKAAEIAAEAENVARHIVALGNALTDDEKTAYGLWLTAREKVQAAAKAI